MEDIVIKRIGPHEAEQLQHISRQTFFEAFCDTNTEEDMKKYLEEALSIERLTTELSDPGSEFYFAELGGIIIAYLKLNHGPSQTELKEDKGLEIERIYVLAEYYGKRVGQLLYEKAVTRAEERGAEYIWLGVWEHNLKAQRFYERNGFIAFGKHAFLLGTDEQTDILMRRDLK